MQNSDLIPRKEVEKMIEKMIIESEKTDIPSTPQFNNMKNFARYELRNLLQELSQIESVNGWIAFDDETPKDWTDIVCTDFTSYATAEVDDWDLIFEYECDIEFTHYMPLPPTPII